MKYYARKLQRLGNFYNFENPCRKIEPGNLIVTPNLMLKTYDMFIEDQDSSNAETLKEMEEFLKEEIRSGKITPRSGLGFAILSKDMLNVARWDQKYPIVLVNDLYQFPEETREISKAEKLDTNVFGSFCVWELEVVNYEREFWMKYLKSQRKRRDKLDYLSRFVNTTLEIGLA